MPDLRLQDDEKAGIYETFYHLSGVVTARQGQGFPKHAVTTSLYALLRHPWLRKVLESPAPATLATLLGASVFVDSAGVNTGILSTKLPAFTPIAVHFRSKSAWQQAHFS
ncbi:hypothetical protein [Marinobacter sp. SS5-14b]|uniref:hypothetical protein n=1 Tax=Marinobacter sp. SS5-14b TaxID=3050456 RepID=UPI0026DECBFF|nr:hypothetical protein [Marinobacter sp. SS5-14b]